MPAYLLTPFLQPLAAKVQKGPLGKKEEDLTDWITTRGGTRLKVALRH